MLFRHGATEQNAAGRFLSSGDPPLSEQGREACLRVTPALLDLELKRCLVSPMRRALETREIVAPSLPFAIERALREVDFGAWEDKTLAWLEVHDPQGLAERRRNPASFRPPGGESFLDVADRLRELAAAIEDSNETLIVAHRGTLGVLERLLRHLPIDSRAVEPLEPGAFRVLD
ncbi:MAG: histidine phosphatase family protein [Candidatus Baltobacteraceae bacterium]